MLTVAACAMLRNGPRFSPAVSQEGQFVRSQVTQVWEGFGRSIALQGQHAEVLAQLDSLVAEHSLPGWDGTEAPPVSWATEQNVRDFISVLPDAIPSPELAVDPDDAAISLEWHGGYRKVFSVSIGDHERLACAGIDGTDQWHAVLRFDGAVIPAQILAAIRQVCA
ncbi:hypothetical protein OPIT5_13200 [Opitutaceae bacterium TAV5]|nr:hypothetical protein OPIT5_13200 [Opitutaceae bacterium TAV5]